MKAKVFMGVAAAALLIGGVSIAKNASHSTLSPLQMENLEVLSRTEAWVEILYDKNCVVHPTDICVRSPYEVHRDAEGKDL